MTEFSVIVQDGAGNPVKNAKVTVDGKNAQYTDDNGKTHYNINEWNKTLDITANTMLGAATGTIAVNLIGNASPDNLTLKLHTDPLAGVLPTSTRLGQTASWLVPLLLVLGVVVTIVTVILLIGKKASPIGIAEAAREASHSVSEKAKSTAHKVGKRARKNIPKGWKS